MISCAASNLRSNRETLWFWIHLDLEVLGRWRRLVAACFASWECMWLAWRRLQGRCSAFGVVGFKRPGP